MAVSWVLYKEPGFGHHLVLVSQHKTQTHDYQSVLSPPHMTSVVWLL